MLAQDEFEELIQDIIKQHDEFFDEEQVRLDIEYYTSFFYNDDLKQKHVSGKDQGFLALELGVLYAQLNERDSAFYYLNINQKLKGSYVLGSNYPILKIIDDPRFDIYLDNSFIECSKTRNQDNSVNCGNTDFTREFIKIQLVNSNINFFGDAKYTKELNSRWINNLEKIKNYRTKRYKQILETSGSPVYSKDGVIPTKSFWSHLGRYSPDVFIENLERLEELALQKEVEGRLISRAVDNQLVLKNELQRYGTCYYYDKKLKKLIPYPIEDIDNVNKRRKQIGLIRTLEEEYKELNKPIFLSH